MLGVPLAPKRSGSTNWVGPDFLFILKADRFLLSCTFQLSLSMQAKNL